MSNAFPRIYSSFADFEREERRIGASFTAGDDFMEDRFGDDGDGASEPPRKRGRPRKNPR